MAPPTLLCPQQTSLINYHIFLCNSRFSFTTYNHPWFYTAATRRLELAGESCLLFLTRLCITLFLFCHLQFQESPVSALLQQCPGELDEGSGDLSWGGYRMVAKGYRIPSGPVECWEQQSAGNPKGKEHSDQRSPPGGLRGGTAARVSWIYHAQIR